MRIDLLCGSRAAHGRFRLATTAWATALGLGLIGAFSASGMDAQWIWDSQSPETEPRVVCFRKTFPLREPDNGKVEITCDESYELFVNGRRVGAGREWKVLDSYDVTPHLRSGKNVVAVLAAKSSPGKAGMVARVTVKEKSGTHVEHSTDSSWKSIPSQRPRWNSVSLDDSRWNSAAELGPLGQTAPWRNGSDGGVAAPGRFTVLRGFRVESVLPAEKTGSVLAMTFNSDGEILFSQENGPLLIAKDTNGDGIHEVVESISEVVKNCQGILALEGRIFAVADGPEGAGLYRLEDADGDGKLEKATRLIKFAGTMGEHAAHGVAVGPDGLIYVIAGNHTTVDQELDERSPYHDSYEGEAVLPRYEDPGGHAAGRKAPGGFIARTDAEGSFVELFAGGLRNAYDLAFNREGELFTYDSDMEWDVGLPWYRPTRIVQLVAGGDYGWRSGWANWPDYFVDGLPPIADTGTGSPTGMVFYDHHAFPRSFRNSLFACDWSTGRILNFHFQRRGAGYTATSELFLAGRPLNVTDIDVGPEGWLYFCTGGRDSEGGIYRVAWTGEIPAQDRDIGTGISALVRYPQPDSAWARRKMLSLKTSLGDDYPRMIEGVARIRTNSADVRVRALALMEQHGPYPSPELLLDLSTDPSEEIRAKVAYLLGLHSSPTTNGRLLDMLHDQHAVVRRTACESVVRAGLDVPSDKLLPMLADRDRFVAFAACRALQEISPDSWKDTVMKSEKLRVFLLGSVALLVAHPDHEAGLEVLAEGHRRMAGYIRDDDFVDLLRVLQLALIRGEVKPDEVPELSRQLAEEFPSSNPTINREVLRLLANLGESGANARIIAYLQSAVAEPERIHTAAYARFLPGWTYDEKLDLIGYLESARGMEGGHSLGGYIEAITKDFAQTLSREEQQDILEHAADWPVTALGVLSSMEGEITPQLVAQIIEQDHRLRKLDTEDEARKRLGIGFVAILAQSKRPEAMEYLREAFDAQPERRGILAMGLAQEPGGANWEYLLRAIPILEPGQAPDVLQALTSVPRRPDKAESLRQVILTGLKLKEQGAPLAIRLLGHWTGQNPASSGAGWEAQMAAWQEWFVKSFPASPPPVPPESEADQWTMDELLEYVNVSAAGDADAARGEKVFEKAQCVKCHRFGTRGDAIGPDLTTVAQRFQRKEILESILYPSHVISDQYASRTVVTSDGASYTGIVVVANNGDATVLVSTGEKKTVKKDAIDEIVPSNVSAMPEGLLDVLTLEEIGDLFAYLTTPPVIAAQRPNTTRPQ